MSKILRVEGLQCSEESWGLELTDKGEGIGLLAGLDQELPIGWRWLDLVYYKAKRSREERDMQAWLLFGDV